MEEQRKELTLERTFDAPRELVFKAWTDPALVAEWWGPHGFTSTAKTWDVTPGGQIDLVMLAGKELGPMADHEFPMNGEFEEIVNGEKLVYTSNAIMDGKEVLTTRNIVTFDEQDGKTKLTVHIVVTMTTPEAAGPLAGMEIGWNQTLDRLVEFVAKQ